MLADSHIEKHPFLRKRPFARSDIILVSKDPSSYPRGRLRTGPAWRELKDGEKRGDSGKYTRILSVMNRAIKELGTLSFRLQPADTFLLPAVFEKDGVM